MGGLGDGRPCRRLVCCDQFGDGEKWRNVAKRRLHDVVPPAALAAWLASESGARVGAIVHMGAISDTTARERSPKSVTELPRGAGEVVLLVDDEQAVREVGKRTLESFGYHVLVASNGAEAISQYAQRRNEIDLVLTDMAMPIMDGTTTILALRALNPGVRIIGSSGLSASSDITRAIGAGLEHFVPKPYTGETLLRTVYAALNGKGGARKML